MALVNMKDVWLKMQTVAVLLTKNFFFEHETRSAGTHCAAGRFRVVLGRIESARWESSEDRHPRYRP